MENKKHKEPWKTKKSRDKEIWEMRKNRYTLQFIADEYNLTRERIRQICWKQEMIENYKHKEDNP